MTAAEILEDPGPGGAPGDEPGVAAGDGRVVEDDLPAGLPPQPDRCPRRVGEGPAPPGGAALEHHQARLVLRGCPAPQERQGLGPGAPRRLLRRGALDPEAQAEAPEPELLPAEEHPLPPAREAAVDAQVVPQAGLRPQQEIAEEGVHAEPGGPAERVEEAGGPLVVGVQGEVTHRLAGEQGARHLSGIPAGAARHRPWPSSPARGPDGGADLRTWPGRCSNQPVMLSSRSTLLCLALLSLLACRDPSAGPAPRKLSAEQRARVESRTFDEAPTPTLVPPVGAVTLGGGAVRYLGATVQPERARRGGQLQVTHYWTCLKPLEDEQRVFVHGAGRGERGVQLNGDHLPVEGLWPTDRWEVGKTYADPHTLEIPEHYAAAELVLHVGLFRFDRRMRVDLRGAHDGSNRIALPPIPIEGGAAPVPEYLAPRAEAPPVLDGLLGDAAWQAAPVVTLQRSNGKGRPRHATWARLAWDEANLYVAFEVEDPDIYSTFEKDDDPLYEQEVVEIFLDADGDGRTYNELQVAPSGRRFDARFPARRRNMDLSWSSEMRIGRKLEGTLNDDGDEDRGWTVELAIPVERLYAVPRWPPGPEDTWRFNLYRLEHPGRSSEEGSALSPPVVPDFHHLPRFARLRFAGSGTPSASDPPSGR
ncbi:MAG: sugar-binding protein [Deltaproteobacteria bacterium]|nr:sugar-binding protein [Deltaproteobacteria bacterium]